MLLILIGFTGLCLMQLLLWTRPLWRFHVVLAAMFSFVQALYAGLAVCSSVSAPTLLFGLIASFQLLNLIKIGQNRIKDAYLHKVTFRTAISLMAIQIVLLTVRLLTRNVTNMNHWYLLVICIIEVSMVSVLFMSFRRHLYTTKPLITKKMITDHDLPTLTVAIPARNETEDLSECLTSLIGSNYPKLEILVLDDCSQYRRTPEIIRGYAHDGVRFIAGRSPSKQWLAKNFAYYQLAQEANGQLILFCGVDTRFEKNSLRNLVTEMQQKKKSMMCVIPTNIMSAGFSLESAMLQASRYAWELMLPRKMVVKPAVLSTCWIIEHSLYHSSGGFAAVKRSIVPERYFAEKAIEHKDSYGFVQSDTREGMNIYSSKSVLEMRATVIRTRYPQLHKRPEMSLLVMLVEFIVFVLPYVFYVSSIISQHWALAVLFALMCLTNQYMYGKTVTLAYRRTIPVGYILAPIAAAYDIVVLFYSMYCYEFDEVEWKGRNICVPIMQVYKSLPQVR
jgi:chlorobactene glucosyltransferase